MINKDVDWMNILEHIANNFKEEKYRKRAIKNIDKLKSIRDNIKRSKNEETK